jgi:hypothetical protein
MSQEEIVGRFLRLSAAYLHGCTGCAAMRTAFVRNAARNTRPDDAPRDAVAGCHTSVTSAR